MKGSYNPSFGISLSFDLPSGGVYTRARTYSGVRNLALPTTSSGYGNPIQFSNTSFDLNRWYKVDFTSEFSGTTYTFKTYVNGTLDNSSNLTNSRFPVAFQNNSALTINLSPLGGSFIRAAMGVAQSLVYNKALSEAEVKQNYYQAPIVTNGLVFAVDPSNLVSYESGSTTTYSLTGSYTGSLQNGVEYLPSNGGVFNFDGTNDIIRSQNINPSEITIEVWKKWTMVSDDWLITNQTSTVTDTTKGYFMRIDEPSFNFTVYFGIGSTSRPIVYNPIVLGEWTHVVATYDPITEGAKLYWNGVLVGTNTGTGAIDYTGVQGLTIGAANNLSRATPGPVGPVRIYNRALSSSEVQQNYEATKYKFLGENIITNGLVLNLDSANKDSYPGTGTTWYDLSGNNNNGTLTNGSSFLPNINGGILDFDGVDDYASLGSVAASLIQGKTAITIGIMFNMDATGTLKGLIGTLNYFCGGNLGLVASNDALLFYNDTATCYSIGLNSYVTTGKWIYAVGTYDGTTTRLYGIKDGTLTQTSGTGKSGNTNVFSSDFRVMGNQNPTIFTNGKGSVAFAYNRVLSQAEVLQNYNAQKTRFGL
jgi:hypothetical protein